VHSRIKVLLDSNTYIYVCIARARARVCVLCVWEFICIYKSIHASK